MARLFCVFFCLGAGACSEIGIGSGLDPSSRGPDILVEPTALDFGDPGGSAAVERTFTIRNEGGGPLEVRDIGIDGGRDFAVVNPAVPFVVEPRGPVDVVVRFAPLRQGERLGQALVRSNDPDEPEVPVTLRGFGNVPDLQIEPAEHEFLEAFVPCGDEVELRLTNVGAQDVVITDFDYATTGDLGIQLEQLDGVTPITLPPGVSTAVTVTWAPTREGLHEGTISVVSNDPVGTETAVQRGTGLYASRREDVFTAPSQPPVDVMFLIDQSGSMKQDNEQTLGSGLPAFFDALDNLSDWQLILVKAEDGCTDVGILTDATPNAQEIFAEQDFGPQVTAPYTESLLALATTAAQASAPGVCNQGALRQGALLHVIVASDEPEQSGVPWSTHLAALESFVAHPSLLRISGIVDVAGRCGLGGSQSGAAGYAEAIAATRGATLDICTASWGQALPDLAAQVLDGVRTYQLSAPAVERSIEVLVNGVPTTAFAYGAETGTLAVFDPPVGDGDVVTVRYGVAVACE